MQNFGYQLPYLSREAGMLRRNLLVTQTRGLSINDWEKAQRSEQIFQILHSETRVKEHPFEFMDKSYCGHICLLKIALCDSTWAKGLLKKRTPKVTLESHEVTNMCSLISGKSFVGLNSNL